MDKYLISGIQQVGIGVENFTEAWKWYAENLGIDIKILEDDTVAELMLPYTGNSAQKRHACIAVSMQGGGGFEIWQYSDRKPQPIDFEIQVGDLGVFVAKIKSHNVKESFNDLKQKGVNILGSLVKDPAGNDTFYFMDPFGNTFQMIDVKDVFYNQKKWNAGIGGAMIGSTDPEKALPIYKDILGYDTVIYDKTGRFDDLKALAGGDYNFRRILLTHKKARKGGFSQMFGKSYIELVQVIGREPKKLFEGRFWGDPGFIQVCFDVSNMESLKKKCESMGYPFTVDSSVKHNDANSFDMGNAGGHFTYIEDPDGTLIELVETHKVPVVEKLGISINMRKRNQEKPLPKMLLKMLRFNKVKF